MAILFPILSFVFISSLIHSLEKRDSRHTWGDSFLLGSIIWSAASVVLIESLSFCHALSFEALAGVWVIVGVLVGWALWKNRTSHILFNFWNFYSWPLTEKILLISIVFIALVIVLTAWIFPPNTWDSMTYHLSRVIHWMQNHSLEHYPTHILRQLSYCPFAEYIILQTVILTGGDHLANFVQFFAMIGSWVGVYQIAAFLGAGRLGQLLAVFLAATIPMGILQGSSTQTDYVASFWLVCFVYCVLRWRFNSSWSNTIFAGLALGLAFLTKAYTYLYAFPFLLLMLNSGFRSRLFKQIMMVVVVLIIALLLNVGYFSRNVSTFGNVYGSTESVENHHLGFGPLLANLLRNMGSNLGTPWPAVNESMGNPLNQLLHQLDSSGQNYEFQIPKISRDEDYAGSLQHLLLGVVTILLWFFIYRREKKLNVYMLCLSGCAVSFALGVNWQPWISRFHLPFFVLACPWLGAIWQRLNIRAFIIVIICIFFIFAQPYVFSGNPRKLVGKGNWIKVPRLGRYFVKKPYLAQAYMNAASGILYYQCNDIGLLIGADDWEYPLWVLLHKGNSAVRLEHLNVNNVSGKLSYPLGGFDPCMIIAVNTPQESWQGSHDQYKKIWSAPPVGEKVDLYIKPSG